tara:strand:+ start:317 stop:2803 length:2487 start_codon:yes stop_codon:yes gene_type:complete
MGLVSRSIPTLLRGVSQGSESTKQADHADIQDNANSDPVLGLTKRSGSQFVSSLISTGQPIATTHVRMINRDVNERYVVLLATNNVRVFELDGTELTVNKPDGVNYLNCTNPRLQLKTITIADFTFIVNTTVTTAMDTTVSTGNVTQAIVFFNRVSDKTTYTVKVDNVVATKDTSNDDPLSTTTVADSIRTSLTSNLTGFTINQNGPVLHIKKNDNSDFTVESSDTQGNTQITTVKNTVQQFTDLPAVAPNGMVVEVIGDESTNFDNYYVKFVTNNSSGVGVLAEGQWEESVEAGIKFKFNYDTMPHVLIRQADGNFRFARVDGDAYTVNNVSFTLPKWGERTVGDEISAPDPSFIGSKINNVFFFRNRLGFLADDNVILSRVSEFFNFFPETVLSVVDSDPIDVAASHTKVAILKNAVNMGEKLILFSDQTQFVLTSSSDSLTPKTANVVVTTEFESTDEAAPVGSGSSIYYLTKKGNFAGVREYISQGNINVKDASNITIHVPRLIPSDIFKVAVSTNEDVLVLLGATNPNVLYVNRWLYGSRSEKILNAWFTYTFDSGRAIKNIDFIGTDLFLVMDNIGDDAASVTLEKIPFASDFKEPNADFEFHLDRKITEATAGVSIAYNSTTKVSTITVPYKLYAKMEFIGRYLSSTETSTYVDALGVTQTLKPGQKLASDNSTNGFTSTITIANADVRNSKFIIGEPFEMHYRFSSQRLTESSGGQRSGEIISGRLQLKHFYIKFEDTGFFKVEVTPSQRDTSTHKFTGNVIGTASNVIGQISLETGTFKVPVMSRADRVTIDVKNNTFLPTILSSAEYEAMFHMRSRRI